MIKIDGSQGEGGGQILRTSLALAALLKKDLQMEKIRSGRKVPGLQPQHLTAAQAVAEITQGRLEGASLNSQNLRFFPGEAKGGEYQFDVGRIKGSAGSVSLILQTIAPLLSLLSEETKITILGGTHVPWSPPLDYLREVFLPLLGRMNFKGEVAISRWGWYPRGGGRIEAKVLPSPFLKGIDWRERGKLENLRGISVVSQLPLSIAERQRNRAFQRLKEKGLKAEIELREVSSSGKGSFFFILAQFENSLAGFSSLGEKGRPAEGVADQAIDDFLAYYSTEAALDPYLADQLILYLSLAKGISTFTTSRLSLHLFTNVKVVEQFLPIKFELEGRLGEKGKVSVEGIGYSCD